MHISFPLQRLEIRWSASTYTAEETVAAAIDNTAKVAAEDADAVVAATKEDSATAAEDSTAASD